MFLASHITKPKYSRAMVDRPRLYQRLDAWREVRAVAITAAAGYGKSSLVSRWLDVTNLAPRAAWVTLDESDADPHQFIHRVAAALAPLVPDALELVLPILNDSHGRPDRALLRLLGSVDELAQAVQTGGEVILVLDDLHRVQAPQVDALLVTLLNHAPPNLHLFLLARRRTGLSLARLYAHGQVLELTANDMRFEQEEIAAYLRKHGFAAPSERDLARLAQRSKGWVTALQLAVLAQNPGGTVAELVSALQGDRGWFSEFLMDEVLNHAAPDLRSFLLQTSILDDFDAPLCAAVTEDADAYARLEAIARADLFLIRVGDGLARFRYHHLFQQFLQQRLATQGPASALTQLHQRAAAYLAAQGQVPAAVHHLLAAGEDDEAAALVERWIRRTVVQNPFRARALLALLPHAVVTRRPQLMLDRCLLGVLFDDTHTLSYAQAAENTIRTAQVPPEIARQYKARLLLWRASGHFLRRELDASFALCQQVQDSLDGLDDLHLGVFHFLQMHLHGYQGDFPAMAQSAAWAAAILEHAGITLLVVAVRR